MAGAESSRFSILPSGLECVPVVPGDRRNDSRPRALVTEEAVAVMRLALLLRFMAQLRGGIANARWGRRLPTKSLPATDKRMNCVSEAAVRKPDWHRHITIRYRDEFYSDVQRGDRSEA